MKFQSVKEFEIIRLLKLKKCWKKVDPFLANSYPSYCLNTIILSVKILTEEPSQEQNARTCYNREDNVLKEFYNE